MSDVLNNYARGIEKVSDVAIGGIIGSVSIPDNVVLHGLKQRNGKFIVRIFGVNDNPKENRLFGRNLDELEDTLGVKFWEENGQTHTLWSAALYQESDTIREAADAALELYEIVTGRKEFDRTSWTAASRKSLCAGFNEADPDAIIAWNKRMAGLGRRYYIWS